MRSLLLEYSQKRPAIRRRLKEFGRLRKAGDKAIFTELCFCLLTPQSKAISCDKAVKTLERSGLLFNGSKSRIGSALRGSARFHNNKAGYIVEARRFFKNGKGLDIKSRLNNKDLFKARDWLVENIKGLGYKEASHFLRNIGLGKGLAILDVHIMRNLKRYGAIGSIPSSISRRTYLYIEDRAQTFSEKAGIPLEELDLLFWSKETGVIFK
ncbi:MAG: N-glycosylase/DNA lyase [Candidatus Omnitrophica bacterium]|nr:N-glycosylase/DNA lyase [Candidatus Omnitrophota bacterium]